MISVKVTSMTCNDRVLLSRRNATDAILRKIACRISWRPCFLDLRNSYWDIRWKSSNLPILVAKSVFLWNSYSRQTSSHLAGTITIEKAARGYSIRLWTPFRSRVIVGFISNFLKNFQKFVFVLGLELLRRRTLLNSWLVRTLLGVSVPPLKIVRLSTNFFLWFFLEFLRNFWLNIYKFDKILVGINSGRSQLRFRIIHPRSHKLNLSLASLILTIDDLIGIDFRPPSEKTYENSISPI